MTIEVFDVGDGASSALSCARGGGLTLIDCGAYKASAYEASANVADSLGSRLGDLTTVMVSHFDTDHWRGLIPLSDRFGALATATRDIALYYPGVPLKFGEDILAGVLALISARDDDPVNAFTLIEKWRSTPNVALNARTLLRGDSFAANGHEWIVHWPPRDVGGAIANTAHRWLAQLHDLAERMGNAGYPLLRDNLQLTYVEGRAQESAAGTGEQRYTEVRTTRMGADGDRAHDTVETRSRKTQARNLAHIPTGFRDEFSKLVKRMSRLDNYLSLVVEDSKMNFIAFGDVEGRALTDLLAQTDSPSLRSSYHVMLAPHHGTHKAPAALPSANSCVSQNGIVHSKKHYLHSRSHRNTTGSCTSTFNQGGLALPPLSC